MIRVEEVMGTAVSVHAHDLTDELADAVFARLRWVDRTFSIYRDDSEVSRLSRGTLRLTDAHPAVVEIVERCDVLRAATDGAFDHLATGRLDPSALVKGWAGDLAAELLRARGVGRFVLNVGGDVLVSDGPGGEETRVGVRHPDRADAVVCAVRVASGAVATSGTYERGEHIAGQTSALRSVTVVGPELGLADALSTAVFAAGDPCPSWMARYPAYEIVAVVGDQVLWTEGIAAHLEWPPPLAVAS